MLRLPKFSVSAKKVKFAIANTTEKMLCFSTNPQGEISMKILWPVALLCLLFTARSHADSWSDPEFFVQLESIAWHSDSTLVQVWLKKSASGNTYTYRYNWASSGHTIETAKAIYSTLLTAQSTGRRLDLYGDHNGPNVWNNFSAVKIKD
jgi:hypothetical protein